MLGSSLIFTVLECHLFLPSSSASPRLSPSLPPSTFIQVSSVPLLANQPHPLLHADLRSILIHLKGIVSRDEIFLKVLTNQINSFCTEYKTIVLKKIFRLVMEKIKDKVLAGFYEKTYKL
jgi:hypothetical protein